ncbi:unnamed protein product [Chilo suppressalis]|uniref:CLIP domain-containing serine protease n=1 Tax=Chilo suppressalis TaxID=168631 RepID=A0ABN8L9F8_CHISP|nr:unnamed protein product [Chilo suppressalis]
MKTIVFTVAFVAVLIKGEPCVSPDGSDGNCVPIIRCPSLMDLVRNKQRTIQDIELLQKSSCGFEENKPKVCCPSSCVTVNGEHGTCVNRTTCPHLPQKYEAKSCSGTDSVCCGPAPNLNIPIINCETSINAYPFPQNSYCCGVDSVAEIKFSYAGSGLSGTKVDQYPWMSLIEYQVESKTKILCGGSLISGKYVLTAAHCITGRILEYGSPSTVRLGEYDTTKELDCSQSPYSPHETYCAPPNATVIIPVESTIAHPSYDQVTTKHDIGLIRLKNFAPYTEFIRPICLPSKDYSVVPPPVFNLFVGGWGIGSSTHQSMFKRDLLLPFVNLKDCQKVYSKAKITLTDEQICAGGEKDKNTCLGDTGGTLMYRGLNSYVAVGIMSFGSTCYNDDIPSVYTNVYKYVDWMYSVMKP